MNQFYMFPNGLIAIFLGCTKQISNRRLKRNVLTQKWLEWATKWLQGQQCLDLLDKVRQLGFEIHRDGLDGPIVTESSLRGFMDLTAKQTKPYVPRN